MAASERTLYLENHINTLHILTVWEESFVCMIFFRESSTVMLRHPGQNISEIAEAAGFVSPSHFTRIFKAREGVSPSNWRKTQGGERAPFRNSDRPLTASNFCLNNNFSCLNNKIRGRDFPVSFFLLILFSNSSVRSHASLQAKSLAVRSPFGSERVTCVRIRISPTKNHN